MTCSNTQVDIKQELKNCNFVKTVLMLLVVFGHSIHFWTGDWFTIIRPIYSSKILCYLSKFLSGFHTYGFVMVSGYIFYYLRIEKNRYNEFFSFMVTKIKRLIIPYVFVAVTYLIPIEMMLYGIDLKHIMEKFVFAIQPSHLWFLWMLFGVFMIAWPLSSYLVKIKWGGIWIGLFLYVTGVGGTKILPDIFAIWTACEFFLFFWIGFEVRRCKTPVIYRVPSFCYIFIYSVLFFINELLPKLNKQSIFLLIAGKIIMILMHCWGALMAFVVLQKLANKIQYQRSSLWSFLEKRSMVIYLFHQPIIYFTLLCFNGKINPFINTFINFSIAMLVSIIISSGLFSWRVTRMLIGEK